MKSGGFLSLLRANRNYRFAWVGQIVSEAGDNFNNVAVFSLALANTHSGLVVATILLSRAASMLPAGPIAGVLLDRMDRSRIMLLSDLVRAVIALCFIFAIPLGRTWLLYLLSGMLMFASPFFTSGRASILPTIATRDELHTANSLTQLTQWTAQAIGSFFGGVMVLGGYHLAFGFNAFSFVFSAACIWQLRVPGGFHARRAESVKVEGDAREPLTEDRIVRPWHEYLEGLRYMRATPLIFGIGLISVGWATGGGAAQILLSLFGDVVFKRGSIGIGAMWGSAGSGLILGAVIAHRIFPRLSYAGYKLTISICYILHGLFFLLFSLSPSFAAGIICIGLSRAAVGVTSVSNSLATSAPRRTRISRTRLLHHRNLDVDDDDGFDERSRLGFRSREPARHRIGGRRVQHVHRVLVGLGELRWQAARAGVRWRRPCRDRSARRTRRLE